ncbi:hypothetical protein [Streptomyces sp. NPDC052811]|uniref:hypothetical protein n=1 Tax=Streptomyces sp. NPDC052811 TaxID=3155731 RepID=UPI00341B264F
MSTVGGDGIEWSRRTKFPFADEWLRYLFSTFFSSGASLIAELAAPIAGRFYPQEFSEFTFDHEFNGTVNVAGESGEVGVLRVHRNDVELVWQ